MPCFHREGRGLGPSKQGGGIAGPNLEDNLWIYGCLKLKIVRLSNRQDQRGGIIRKFSINIALQDRRVRANF